MANVELSDYSMENSNRLFVGNLSESITEEELKQEFGVYGSLKSIVIVQDKFAFVTFETNESAQDAWKANNNSTSTKYKVGYAYERPVPVPPKKQKTKAERDFENIQYRLTHLSLDNKRIPYVVVVQCNTSHLSRLQSYITEQKRNFNLSEIGSLAFGKKRVTSLLFLEPSLKENTNDLVMYASRLAQDTILKPALNQVSLLSPKLFCDDEMRLPEAALDDLFRQAPFAHSPHPAKKILRVVTCPPRLKPIVAERLCQYSERNKLQITLAPTGFTHVFSFVQIDNDYFLLGLSSAETYSGLVIEKGKINKDRVSRAYFKLQEALNRYSVASLHGKVAMDCGASPGGWTRFLVQNGCSHVYAIDPAVLDEQVRSHANVTHLRMKTCDAILHLEKQAENTSNEWLGIDVFVSDMCLKDMDNQAKLMLQAKALLNRNALFVLTLKCVVGHSKESFDSQTNKVVESLRPQAYGIEVMHLFSNRSAERTVIGYLK